MFGRFIGDAAVDGARPARTRRSRPATVYVVVNDLNEPVLVGSARRFPVARRRLEAQFSGCEVIPVETAPNGRIAHQRASDLTAELF